MIKIIDSTQYHLWTDALHARALAAQTKDEWDRGTYIRWTILTAWSSFEAVCVEILNDDTLGMRFKERLTNKLNEIGCESPKWGEGIWQKVLRTYELRKKFTHIKTGLERAELFPSITQADEAIEVMRNAIKEICRLTSNPNPKWVEDNEDRGWQIKPRLVAYAQRVHEGVNQEGTDTIKTSYVLHGKEHFFDFLPPTTDFEPYLNELIDNLKQPAESVRAYRGDTLLKEVKFCARGSSITT